MKDKLINDLLKTVGNVRSRMAKNVANIRCELEDLRRDVVEANLYLDALYESNREEFLRRVAEAFGTSIPAAAHEVRTLRYLKKRGVIDRVFLQEMSIVPKPAKKRSTAAPKPSKILKVASLVENVGIAIGEITDDERKVMNAMLENLQEKLKSASTNAKQEALRKS